MFAFKRALTLSALAIMLTLKGWAQNSLGDPVLYEDFGYGDRYSPVGPPLPKVNSGMGSGGDGRCPSPGRYLILNSSANCYGDTFATINFDHSNSNPFGYLMMVNGDSAPVVYYTNVISGSKFCSGAKYQLAVFLQNINTQKPRPADYADPNILFTVKSGSGAVLVSQAIGLVTSDGFTQYYVDFIAPADGADVTITLSNAALTGTIGNDFAMDDITVKPYGPVIDAGIGSPTGPISATQCLGDKPAQYILKSFPHNYASPRYQWQFNYNKAGWKDIAGATSATIDLSNEFLAPATGVYQYRVGVLSGPGVSLSCQTFSVPIVINVVKYPLFKLPPITYVCEGEALSIHADGGTDYLWTYPDGHTSTTHFLDVTPNVTKEQEGIYSVIVNNQGCSVESKTQVRVEPALFAKVDNDAFVICEGQSVQIGASGGLSYKWVPATGLDHDDVAKPVASPTESIKYSVFVSNTSCIQERLVKLTVLKSPTAHAGPDRTMWEEEPITLNASASGGNITHFWTPADYMDDPTSLNPQINPPDDITYTLHVESPDNCGIITDEMHVRVFKKLRIPASFTPNGDGVNDTWHIEKLYTYPESVLTVYTREGREVFRTVGDAKQWDGVQNGKALAAGTYYYVINLKNNLPPKAGWVMLLK